VGVGTASWWPELNGGGGRKWREKNLGGESKRGKMKIVMHGTQFCFFLFLFLFFNERWLTRVGLTTEEVDALWVTPA
jgi:hypothetical protein